jgi:hypothetical protein
MITRYKEQDPQNAEKELAETKILMDRLHTHLMEQGQKLANVSK